MPIEPTVSLQNRLRVRWWLWVLVCICVGVLSIVAFFYFRQHSMLYHPRPYDSSYATALPADGAELNFTTVAGKQVAFYLPPPGRNKLPTRIWIAFCGNGSLALDWVPLLKQDRHIGDAFLLIDYPGYGKSEGYATIATTRVAADGALKALANHLRIKEDQMEPRLSVIGHSWGTAVALDFATRHSVQRAVLIAVFTTLREEAATMVGRPLSHLLLENYDNRSALFELARRRPPPQVEIFHGTDDEVIPFRMGRELSEDFPAFVKFHPVGHADHVGVLSQASDEIIGAMND